MGSEHGIASGHRRLTRGERLSYLGRRCGPGLGRLRKFPTCVRVSETASLQGLCGGSGPILTPKATGAPNES